MKNISDKVVAKFKTQTSCSITSTTPKEKKKCHLRGNVKTRSRTGQVTDDNMVHAHCMLDT